MKKFRTLAVAAIASAALVLPATAAQAAPANGACVASGVKNLRSAIPQVAPSGAVAGIILSHAFTPEQWSWEGC